jgi:hypothetical protein
MWFLYVKWQIGRVPATRPKSNEYGYEFLPVGISTDINFYPQPLCWRADNCSIQSEPDPLPSLATTCYRTNHTPWNLSNLVSVTPQWTGSGVTWFLRIAPPRDRWLGRVFVFKDFLPLAKSARTDLGSSQSFSPPTAFKVACRRSAGD